MEAFLTEAAAAALATDLVMEDAASSSTTLLKSTGFAARCRPRFSSSCSFRANVSSSTFGFEEEDEEDEKNEESEEEKKRVDNYRADIWQQVRLRGEGEEYSNAQNVNGPT